MQGSRQEQPHSAGFVAPPFTRKRTPTVRRVLRHHTSTTRAWLELDARVVVALGKHRGKEGVSALLRCAVLHSWAY